MNTKDKTNTVMDAPEFYSSEHYKKFLLEQLEEYKKVKDGDSTWKQFDMWRQGKGYTPTNPDSLRRSWQQLGVYLDHGLVGEKEATSPLPTTSTVKTSTNFSTGESTSEKTITLKDEDLTSPRSLLVAHGFDPNKFEIKTVTNTEVSRHVERLISGDEITTHTVNSRVVVKPREGINFGEVADYFKNFRTPHVPWPWDVRTNDVYNNSDELLVVPIYDVHFGRREYTAGEFKPYDIEEEKEKIVNHFTRYIDKLDRTFNEVILVIGQDYFNSSFTNFTSSQSHLQDNAVDPQVMYKEGIAALITLIERYSKITPSLKVIGNLGNHSTNEEYMAFMVIEAYFRNDPSITIDSSPAFRKYYRYGDSLIGFAHADKEHKRLAGLMQVEAKEDWAKSSTHVWLTGHLHHFKVESEHGVEIYRVPSICVHDEWTNKNGFTANDPKSMGFVFDKDGLSETHTIKL